MIVLLIIKFYKTIKFEFVYKTMLVFTPHTKC